MQEVELKFSLADREEFERARKILGRPKRAAVQVNHYFVGDPKGRLDRGEALLRLRVKAEGAVLTFKDGLKKTGALYECREVEGEVSPAAAQDLLAGRRSPLDLDTEASLAACEALGGGSPRIAGASETERAVYDLAGADALLLDRTRFPGGREDYEIEIETLDPPSAEAAAWCLFGIAGIVLKPQTRTKVARFLAAIAGTS